MIKQILLLTIIMSSSLSAYAFDTRTHVWVSQQVINDIEEDGDLDIPPFYNLPISEDRKNAILSQKESYRLGNIGPDGFPDLLTGQQTTHPGILGGGGPLMNGLNTL